MWRQVPSSIHTVSTDSASHHPEQRVAIEADRGAVALVRSSSRPLPQRAPPTSCTICVCARPPSIVVTVLASTLVVGVDHDRDRGGGCPPPPARGSASGSRPYSATSAPAKAPAVDQRHRAPGTRRTDGVGERARVDRLAQLAACIEGRPAGSESAGRPPPARCWSRRPGRWWPTLARRRYADPGQGDLGRSRVNETGLAEEVLLVDLRVHDLARDAHQLLLVLDQAQADLLLGDLGVALDRGLLALQSPRCAGTRRPK